MRVVLVGGGAPVLASVAIALVLIGLQGVPDRFPESLNKKSEALLANAGKARGRCNEGAPTAPLPPSQCILGRSHGKVNFLLVGDSHANHFTGFLDVLGQEANLRGYDMTRSNTPFLPGVERWTLRDGTQVHHTNFSARNTYVSELLRRETFDIIVLAGSYTSFHDGEIIRAGSQVGREALESGLRAAIREAKLSSSSVVVIETIPLLSGGLYDCTLRAERFRRSLECGLPISEYFDRTEGVRALFASLKEEFSDVIWVDPSTLMCDGEVCVTEVDGTPLYRDDGHLNDMGSRLLARKWISTFGNPLVSHTSETVQGRQGLTGENNRPGLSGIVSHLGEDAW